MWSVFERSLDKSGREWHNTATNYGGVGAPVGLTVFKTAGGPLGAVPGGFDSHTPLPLVKSPPFCAVRNNFRISKKSAIILEKILSIG